MWGAKTLGGQHAVDIGDHAVDQYISKEPGEMQVSGFTGPLSNRISALKFLNKKCEDKSQGLKLLTMHGSKGLEFDEVWLAGCASGEEVYSTAILFKEEGLDRKTQIIATDFNKKILIDAGKGVYAASKMKGYTLNYLLAGGKSSFQKYFTRKYPHIAICDSLKNNIRFVHHNLVSNGSLGEMHIIFCRNVLIYFNRDLQNRVFRLFRDSLCNAGYLCLGSEESPRFSTCSADFEAIVPKEKIYRKKSI
jgi:chemotaxis protein methyltransferase CheR